MSFLDAMFNYLAVDPADGFKLIDAFEIENSYIDTNISMIITQIYDHFIASNIKLKLAEYYDYVQEVCIVNGAGVKNLGIRNMYLCMNWIEVKIYLIT